MVFTLCKIGLNIDQNEITEYEKNLTHHIWHFLIGITHQFAMEIVCDENKIKFNNMQKML